MRFKKRVGKMAARVRHITIKGYRFGMKIRAETKQEFARIQKQRQDEKLRIARAELKQLKQIRKEVKTVNKVASLKEELRRMKTKRKNPFAVQF